MKRNLLNIVMTGMLLTVMNYRFMGNVVHEMIGVFLCILFLLHNQWNQRWYHSLGKGRIRPRRLLVDSIVLLLLAAILAVFVSGILISQTVFAPLGLRGSLTMHELHSGAAYSAFLLLAMHLGLHGEVLLLEVRRCLGLETISPISKFAGRSAMLLFMGYGVYASFARDIGDKLLVKHMWGEMPSFASFTFDYLAIMGLYAGLIHYIPRGFRSASNLIREKRRAVD